MKRIGLLFFLLVSAPCLYAQEPFLDLAKEPAHKRVARSKIIQFCYTAEKNIGDYLPTLGIRMMMGTHTDLWNLQDKNIDFEFINRNYSCGIIGGAGILSKRSEHFYKRLLQECTIPLIIWGVGMCLPFGKHQITDGISAPTMQVLKQRCSLINVRDTMTKEYYGLDAAWVAVCPSLMYVRQFTRFVDRAATKILFVSHDENVPAPESAQIFQIIKACDPNAVRINNCFTQGKTVHEIAKIIKDHYCTSGLVVTTRLHGAIIAYSLGIPYIAIEFDKKVGAFHQTYGNGLLAKNVGELALLLAQKDTIVLKPIEYDGVKSFGFRAREWAAAVTGK